MLNLTYLLSERPAPIKGARRIYGRSGANPTVTRGQAAMKNDEPITRTQRVRAIYRDAMKGNGWLSNAAISKRTGAGRAAINNNLKRLMRDGYVRQRKLEVNFGPSIYEYLWIGE